jgi:hypothetical protein
METIPEIDRAGVDVGAVVALGGTGVDVGAVVALGGTGTPVAFATVGAPDDGAAVTLGLVVTAGGAVTLGGVVPGTGAVVEGAEVGVTGGSVVPDGVGSGDDTGVEVDGAFVTPGLSVGAVVTAGVGAADTTGGSETMGEGATVGKPGGATQQVLATFLRKMRQEALLNKPA